mmetsp:Transcript_88781/g.236306  ORF Transcript_88781/g.236306 Transcript_88781/m.236306 type:complete len:931 (-) Transcript_88781:51-2843(-)
MSAILLSGTSRDLKVFRRKSDPTVERRIGYRYGVGDASYNPIVVDCPTTPCPPASDLNYYFFQIDRLSQDRSLVYARFTYELILPQSGAYTAFFEGCCRPPISATSTDINNAQGLYVANNYDLPFHLRTDIKIGITSDYALGSARFSMPDMVVLRKGGLSPKACDSSCLVGCTLQFQLQTFHPDDRFQNQLQYAMGNAQQMGLYKCLEHLSPSGTVVTDSSAANIALSTYASRCVSGMRTPVAPTDAKVSLGGVVTFPVTSAGIWQMTIMVTCRGCYGGTDGSSAIDLLIRVQDSSSDPTPPITLSNASSVSGLTPPTTRAQPVRVTCGRPGFTVGSNTLASSLRVAFADPDDGQSIVCVSTPNTVDWIYQSNDFPSGLSVTSTVRKGSLGYVDLTWTPKCEDVSQVGLFMLCFTAKDTATAAGFQPLLSMPSPFSGTDSSSSCIFIRSLPPPSNPSPTFAIVPEPLTIPLPCTASCCSCCGQSGCACQALGTRCCDKIYAQAGAVKALDFRAVDVDSLQTISIVFTFPEGGPSGGLPSGVSMPAAQPFKYGCSGDLYSTCSAVASVTSDVTTQLRWDLTNMSDYFCSKSGSTCSGLNSACAGGSGDVCQQRQVAQKTVAPFKVCFQSKQVIPSTVNQVLYQAIYGFTVANDSCTSCFVVSVLSPPFFISLSAVVGGTPNDQRIFYLAVGEPLSIDLLGGSINIGMSVTTVLTLTPPRFPTEVGTRDSEGLPIICHDGVRLRLFTANHTLVCSVYGGLAQVTEGGAHMTGAAGGPWGSKRGVPHAGGGCARAGRGAEHGVQAAVQLHPGAGSGRHLVPRVLPGRGRVGGGVGDALLLHRGAPGVAGVDRVAVPLGAAALAARRAARFRRGAVARLHAVRARDGQRGGRGGPLVPRRDGGHRQRGLHLPAHPHRHVAAVPTLHRLPGPAQL